MSAYLVQTAAGEIGPFLDRDDARNSARTGETIVEVTGYVITRTAEGFDSEHTGPYESAAEMGAALAELARWDGDTFGADGITYEVSYH